MSGFQKQCVLVGAFLFVLLACFPPWTRGDQGVEALRRVPMGFHCIFTWRSVPRYPGARRVPCSTRVDVERLLILWAAVAVGTCAAAVAWPGAKRKRQGSASVLGGISSV